MPVLIYPSSDSPSSSSFLSTPIRQPRPAAQQQQQQNDLTSRSTITTTTSPPSNHNQHDDQHAIHIFARSSTSVSGATLGIIIGVSIGSLLLMGVAYIYWLRARQWRRRERRRRKRRKSKESTGSGGAAAAGGAAPPADVAPPDAPAAA
ncbi:hypothetical protein B7463_g4406, partial [Scytalidium lignicola]